MKRDLLSIADLSLDEINGLFERAERLKSELAGGARKPVLAGYSLAMVFEKASTRTRTGFEVAMTQMGGHAIYMTPADSQLGRSESIPDTARVLASYCDAILIRTFAHEAAVEMAKYSGVPVINGLTDLLHPCQVLSDIFTIKEKLGTLEGVKVAYTGDGNNMANSWLLGASKTGVELAIACPEGYDPDPEILAMAMEGTGAKIEITRDPARAADGANVLYTDVWASMGQEEEAEARKAIFQPFQLNSALLEKASPGAMVMHCLPAHRGEEITAEVADGPNSVIFEQAENRLHAQKAILEWLLE